MNNFSCHLIGLNPFAKKEFLNNINNKIFNIIDLDSINQAILKDENLDKMYRQYQKLKEDKNDKFKEVDKKMSEYWEKNFTSSVQDKVKTNKMNILIGQNNHYKSLNKRVPIECTNKFIVKAPIDDEVKSWIKYNLETYKDDIINGNFPLDYINYDFLQKRRINIENIYKKIGYIEKSLDQINTIINLVQNKKEGKEVWISLKEPYNIGSLIHPKNNDKLLGYSDPDIAIINSINFNENEVNKIIKGREVTLQEIKPNSTNKLKTRRFLYLVDSSHFTPMEDNIYFSQLPVKVLAKERIDNVHKYLIK